MSRWKLGRTHASTVLGAVLLLAACSGGSGSGDQGPPPPSCTGADCARTCSGGKVACSGSCVDTQNDALNCGGCGLACAQGDPCVAGSCACQQGLTRCDADGGGAVCTDRSSDPANCGTCGNACAANESCIGGACVCPVGDLQCDGVCTDPMTSPEHCGAMNACDADAGSAGTACTAAQYCKTGACTPCTMWSPVGRVPVSQSPRVLATADLNGDGKPDLLTGSPYPAALDVFLGRGDGTFEAVQILAATLGGVNRQLGDPVVADFDGDGRLDVAMGGPVVYYGYGDGTFDPNGQHLASSTEFLASLTAADVNGDGRPDIVGADPSLPGFDVHLNLGGRSFAPPVALQTGTPYSGDRFPMSVTVADVNGDGKADLLLGNDAGYNYGNDPSSIELWLGNGDATFAMKTSYIVGTAVLCSAVADFNGDGKLDVATADVNGVAVGFGNGDGTFTFDTGLVTYGAPTRVVAKDVSGDGIPDLVVSGRAPAYGTFALLEVRIGVGDGSFYPADAYEGGSAEVGVADVDGDGRMDLLAGDYEASDVIVYLGGKHPGCK